MSDADNTECAACCAPTTKKCAGCMVRTYCSKTCQTKDWPAHKKVCGDLKLELMLARAAAVIQDAYLAFRKNTWDTTIDRVEDREDALIIHDGNPGNNPQVFVEFPQDKVPNNKRAELGVLTTWMCDEPYAFMANLIEKILYGLDIDCEEISVRFKTVPRKTIVIYFGSGEPHSNWPGYQHKMLRVKSRKTGKHWILDIAGGQYGIVEAVHDWSKYEKDFVEKIVGVFEVGTQKHILSEVAKVAGIPTISYGLVGTAAAVLDKALVAWETKNQPISSMRALSDTAYTAQKASLLDVLDKAVRTFVSTNDFSDVVRKARADDSVFARQMTDMIVDQLYNEANLLMRYPEGKPTMMDRLCEKFGPSYTYRDGNEYCLSVDELLRFYNEEFN